MARKPKPLSVAEHRELGQRLGRLRDEITDIGHLLADRFPPRFTKQWNRATNPLADIRYELQEEFLRAMIAAGLDDGVTIHKCYLGQPQDAQDARESA